MNPKYAHLQIQILPIEYKYILLHKETNSQIINDFVNIQLPIAIFCSAEELSAIVPMDFKIASVSEECGWCCFKIVGEMPFGTVQGLISKISSCLAADGIGVCIVSSYKSDWFFIRSKYKIDAVNTLSKDGWRIEN